MNPTPSARTSINIDPDEFKIETTTQDVTVGYFMVYTTQNLEERKSLNEKIQPNVSSLSIARHQACQAVAQCLAEEVETCYFAQSAPENGEPLIVRFESKADRNRFVECEGGSIPDDSDVFMHMAQNAARVNF